jgi:hypothetical protein
MILFGANVHYSLYLNEGGVHKKQVALPQEAMSWK